MGGEDIADQGFLSAGDIDDFVDLILSEENDFCGELTADRVIVHAVNKVDQNPKRGG